MNNKPVISFILHGHTPFVRHPEGTPDHTNQRLTNLRFEGSGRIITEQFSPSQEQWFFESLSETWIPLLEVFDRLERDHVPFRMGLSLSPVLCHMLSDEYLIKRYLLYIDRQIEFGAEEMERSSGDPELHSLAKLFYDRIVDKRIFFTERYEKNILKGFDYYHKKGRIELLATSATNAFLPFYTAYPEAVQAEFEVAISVYRGIFGKYPQGFWLPELGWKHELDPWLRAYNFSYTIIDTHGLVLAQPCPDAGSFYPVRTPMGIFVFGRDFYAAEDMHDVSRDPAYRNEHRDQGYELPADKVKPFLSWQGSRSGTGYKYWAAGKNGSGSLLYDPVLADEKVKEKTKKYLESRISRLQTAGRYFKTADNLRECCPLSLLVFEADNFGRFWHEGPVFIENFFREGVKTGEINFMTPSEYLCKLNPVSFQTITPEFSSWGANGYAETWLDSSNDWMYSHTMRALDRMVEIAERFPDDTGLKERALNQAARELLLVLSSDWPKMLYKQENAEYARSRIEGSLKNFTTIYEALGSNYISTEWLTHLEKRHNIFPNINYRVFRRKR